MIAAADGNEWLSYGRDYGEQRFSPLTQISDENVGELGLAWFADLETARGQEATPLMHDGVLYVSTAWSMVKAFDARTGELKWSYDPEVPRETLAAACCDAVNRGVALYGDKVYVATLDGYLVALNQSDGKVAWRKEVVPDHDSYTITGAPRVAKGKVFIGSGGAEFRARGFIAAFDWATGEELWRFHTVPGNPADGFENAAMERAAATWGGEWWELGGGGTVWDSITYDPATNLVLFGTGNAEPWNPAGNGRDKVAGARGLGRQPLHQLDRRGERRHRRVRLALPGNARGPLGLRFQRPDHARRPDHRRRAEARRAARAEERLFLHPRREDRQVPQRHAVDRAELDARHRSGHRPARDQSRGALRDRRAALGQRARRGRRAFVAADELQPADRAGLHPRQQRRLPVLRGRRLAAERDGLPDRARSAPRPRCRRSPKCARRR